MEKASALETASALGTAIVKTTSALETAIVETAIVKTTSDWNSTTFYLLASLLISRTRLRGSRSRRTS